MKATVKHLVKKVTLELVYDVVDERTKELKEQMKEMREDIKAVNTRIDQIHMRLDQIMHMLADIKRQWWFKSDKDGILVSHPSVIPA